MVPGAFGTKKMAFFDANRRLRKGLEIHRMRIRTFTGKERKLDDYTLPPVKNAHLRWDEGREEWMEINDEDELNEGDIVMESMDSNDN